MKRFIILLALLPYLMVGHTTTVKSGENITINTPVEGDLYIAGKDLTIEAVIKGDIIGAGANIFIRDTIREDAILAGGNLYLEAPVLDDARLGGGKIIIRSDVFGDLVIGGGEIEIERGVTIHGDLYIGGGEVMIAGKILGKIDIGGGEVVFMGEGMGAANIKAGEFEMAGIFRGPTQIAAYEISLTDKAQFHESIRYWQSAGDLDFGASLQGTATATFDESLKTNMDDRDWRRAFRIGGLAFILFRILSSALLILLLIWAFNPFFERAVKAAVPNVMAAFGFGIIYLLAIPVLLAISFISIIGIPAGVLLMHIYGFSLALSHILAAILFVYWIPQNTDTSWTKGQKMLSAIGIYVLLRIVSWIPFVGWFISLVVMAAALGIVLLGIFRKPKSIPSEL